MDFIKLQINAENLDLDQLTEMIGLTPTFTCKKGTKVPVLAKMK